MDLLGFLRRGKPAQGSGGVRPQASGQTFSSLSDPALLEFMRGGSETASGAFVSARTALLNTTVFRCVDLISASIGMLPVHLFRAGDDKEKATDHPLYRVLTVKPNGWQTPFEFKQLLQTWALVHENACARVVRSAGRVVQIIPLEPSRLRVEQRDDFTVEYIWSRKDGGTVSLPPQDVFHLRGLSLDGVNGLSRTRMAKEAIGLALQAEQAAARLFKNGMMVGGALTHPGKLSDAALARLRESLEARFTGAENAHRWLIFEEGMEAKPFAQTATDSQHIENRKHQIEEIARVFGVPRPLLMMDDTSWGSGIEQLGIYFVQYALQPWFTAWEQAIARSLLTEDEAERFYAKFNANALLRGSIKDQAEFFAKALGSGGHSPWLEVNEVRDLSERGRVAWGEGPPKPPAQQQSQQVKPP